METIAQKPLSHLSARVRRNYQSTSFASATPPDQIGPAIVHGTERRHEDAEEDGEGGSLWSSGHEGADRCGCALIGRRAPQIWKGATETLKAQAHKDERGGNGDYLQEPHVGGEKSRARD